MKDRLSHLQYDWWRYLLVAVAVIALWNTVFSMLAQPKEHEQLSLCYFGESFDPQACEESLRNSLGAYTAQPLKKITAEHRASAKDSALVGLVETGVYAGDLLIFEQGVVPDSAIQAYINRLDTEKLEAYLEGLNQQPVYYYVDQVPYGILLDSVPGYTGTKGCILCLSPDSVNLGGMYGRTDAQQDAALAVLRCWMEEQT